MTDSVQLTPENPRYWHLLFNYALEQILPAKIARIESEVALTTLPMRVDFIAILQAEDTSGFHPITQNFRSYNLIEFKSPQDYLTIDDFYKVMIYIRLYQHTRNTGDYWLESSSVTFVCSGKPVSLFQNLEKLKFTIFRDTPVKGIYQITGEICPIQVVVLNEMTDLEVMYPFVPFITGKKRELLRPFVRLMQEGMKRPENAALRNLIEYSLSNYLVKDYEMKEVSSMIDNEATRRMELMKDIMEKIDRYEERRKKYLHDTRQAMRKGLKKGIARGMEQGIEKGVERCRAEIIQSALHNGADVTYLAKITGISEEEIVQIQKSKSVS